MKQRYYSIGLQKLTAPCRILQISDVHFSNLTTCNQNRRVMDQVLTSVRLLRPDVIAVTGDIVSRNPGKLGIPDAVAFLGRLAAHAPVLFVPGNHEMDLPKSRRNRLFRRLREQGVILLYNRTVILRGIAFSGVVLPRTIYKNSDGGYRNLEQCTPEMLTKRLGSCRKHPHVLLAHSPMGLPAYARWGADAVLSGHVHGGIVRLPGLGGILSPERKFFPRYTRGLYRMDGTVMAVSAGIGKLRIGNPAEVVCVDLMTER